MSTVKTRTKATRVLVISRGAGNMKPDVEAKLRKVFADYLVVDFDPDQDIEKLISSRARIVVACGFRSGHFQ